MKNLANQPRNAIGDRAGPRYSLKTFKLSIRACEPGAKVDSSKAAVPVLRQILSRLDADQEHFILLAGQMLDLQVHDHLILGRDTFSFALRGELQ